MVMTAEQMRALLAHMSANTKEQLARIYKTRAASTDGLWQRELEASLCNGALDAIEYVLKMSDPDSVPEVVTPAPSEAPADELTVAPHEPTEKAPPLRVGDRVRSRRPADPHAWPTVLTISRCNYIDGTIEIAEAPSPGELLYMKDFVLLERPARAERSES